MTQYVPPSEAVRSTVEAQLADLGDAGRVLVAGGPRVGKSTLAELAAAKLGVPAEHTDDTIDLGWSNASAEVKGWLDRPRYVVEGVALPRALRKWLAEHPEGKPCDTLYWSNRAKAARTPGQAAMAKGCETVWTQILGELRRRGVVIRSF